MPEDISVTGFDNYPFIRRNASGLTTVDVDIAMMASEGVELLLERLNDKRENICETCRKRTYCDPEIDWESGDRAVN